ncbi:MAG: murein biosynthesis integral membrane protein MurJ [Myxococcales bacterium]|nr:murein biosynthesis integral membrane protein MurJ [Myxococcales bacterium]
MPAGSSTSGSRVVRRHAALAIGIANLLGRLSGLARDVIFAAVFGAGAVSDAYNAALRVPMLLRELVAEGSLQNVVVPAFADTAERDGLDAAWTLANAVLGVLLLFLGACTLVFWLGAEWWVRLVADSFTADPSKLALATTLTRWLSPFLASLSLAAYFGGLLNGRGRFFVPAMAQNVLSLGVIAACLVGGDIVTVAAATTLSGFVQVGLCIPPLWSAGFRFRPTFGGHPALGRMLRYFGTAVVGVATVQASVLIECQWASSYGDGVLTWLLGSFRLVQLPLALVAGSLITAMLPALSSLCSRGDHDGAGRALERSLRTHALLVLPAAVGLGLLADPIVAFVYERGAFEAADTRGTADMLRMYALATYGICLHRMLVPVCYALGRPRLPMWLSIGAVATKVPIILLLTRGVGMDATALPLSHAITVSGEAVGLLWGLRELLRGRGLVAYHARLAAAVSPMAALAFWLAPRVHLLVVVAACGVLYGAVAWALGAIVLPVRPERR